MSRETQVLPAPKGQGQPGFRQGLARLRTKFGGKENRSPILFTGSSITLSVAQMLAGLLTVHLISPRDMGLWSSVNLALTYAFFVLAGVQNGLSRELPYYLGAKNEGMARRLAATALYYTAAGGLLAVLAGFGAVLFLTTTGAESKLIYSIAAIALLILFRFYQNYLFITFRSKDSFLALAGVQGWQALLMIVTLPILFLGYGGLLGRAVLIAGLGLYLMHRARPLSVMPVWKTDSFLLLFRTGVPIFATDYISSCAGTLDKVALLRFGGVEQVGLYALAMSAYTAFAVIPQSIAHYIYPRMSHHYGRTHNPRVLWTL